MNRKLAIAIALASSITAFSGCAALKSTAHDLTNEEIAEGQAIAAPATAAIPAPFNLLVALIAGYGIAFVRRLWKDNITAKK